MDQVNSSKHVQSMFATQRKRVQHVQKCIVNPCHRHQPIRGVESCDCRSKTCFRSAGCNTYQRKEGLKGNCHAMTCAVFLTSRNFNKLLILCYFCLSIDLLWLLKTMQCIFIYFR